MQEVRLVKYLREQTILAAKQAFPEYEPLEFYPEFTYKHMVSTELSTSFAFKLAKKIGLPVQLVSSSIMAKFQWDHHFVNPDQNLKSCLCRGFINFSISDTYLTNSFIELCNHPDPKLTSTTSPIPLFAEKAIRDIDLLLKHAPAINQYKPQDLLSHIKSQMEIQLLKLIAVSNPLDLFSSDGANFHLRNLTSFLTVFLKQIPVFTSSQQQTLARIALMRAALIRIFSLVNII